MSSVLYDVPGPRARLRNRMYTVVAAAAILGLLAFVGYRLEVTGQFRQSLWDPFLYTDVQERIGEGILATLKAFAIAAVLSIVTGAVLAIGRLSEHRIVRWPAVAVVEFFRAMPLLIMIFALYIGVFTASPLWALVIGLTLYNGSVQAEIFRAGILAVSRGQSEAAYAIGMRKTQVMLTVLIPQAVRSMLPSIISQLVVTLKDTSLGFIITYEELLYVGRLIASNSSGFPYVQMIIIVAPLYIAMCMALSWFAHWLERRGRRSRTGIAVAPTAPGADAEEVAAPVR